MAPKPASDLMKVVPKRTSFEIRYKDLLELKRSDMNKAYFCIMLLYIYSFVCAAFVLLGSLSLSRLSTS